MINGPRDRKPSLTSRSRTTASCAVDLDEDTIEEVAKSKSAIKDMFESSMGSKITFGGTGGGGGGGILKSNTEQLGAKPKVRKNSSGQFTERKWVFDTINKYFDVIKEDEEEEEGANDEDSSSEEYQDAVSNTPSARGHSSSSTSVVQRSTSNVVARLESAEVESESDEEDESDDSEVEEGAEDQNQASSSGVMKSSSSAQLQSMLKSILTSRKELSIDTFKANLSAHLKKSTDTLSGGGSCTPDGGARRSISLNREPGVRDSEDEEGGAVAAGDPNDTEITYETDKYLRIPL